VITSVIQRKRPRWPVLLLIGGGVVAAGLFAAAVLAVVPVVDTKDCEIEVANKNSAIETCTTNAGAIVSYIPDSGSGASSGTGVFVPFARVQGSPTEDGYNTDGNVQFETKTGTWTHSILVSDIPVRNIGGTDYWEIFVDINDSNGDPLISLNEVEVWFTDNANLVGYVVPTGFPSGAVKQYDFSGNITIKDVNQGSGRADLIYMIPLTGIDVGDCNYGSSTCSTYFVLYSEWGTTSGYPSDGGFEEWKTKQYPTIELKKVWVGPGSSTLLRIGTTVNGSETDSQQTGAAGAAPLTTGTNLVGEGTFYVSETGGLTGYSSSLACLRDGVAFTPGTNNSVVFGSNDFSHVVCTFTNTKLGKLTIIKDTVPNGATDFAYTGSGTGLSNFSLDDDGVNTGTGGDILNTKVFSGLANGGTRTVTETTNSNYSLSNIVCSGATTSTVTIGAAGAFDAGDTAVNVTLADGDEISCTFTNTKLGSLTIVKDTVPDDGTDFAYTTSGAGMSNFSLDDDGETTILSNTKLFSNLSNGVARTATETTNANYSLSNIVCTGATGSTVVIGAAGAFDAGDTGVTVTLANGEDVTCTFTNTLQLGAIKITKTSTKGSSGLDGATFSITKGGTAIPGSPFTTANGGIICVDTLNFGDYVVTETAAPTGYLIDDPAGRTITVDNNALCSDTTFVGETTSFTNTPLSTIRVQFTSLAGANVTRANISCSVPPVTENGAPVSIILSNSAANPTVVTTFSAHGLTSGTKVKITASGSTPSIDGLHTVTVLSPTTFSVPVNVTVAGSLGFVSPYDDTDETFGNTTTTLVPGVYTCTIDIDP